MRMKLYRSLLALLLLAIMSTALSLPVQAIAILQCEGFTVTIRSGNECIRCHFTICCVALPNGEVDCTGSEPICTECGTGTPV